MATWAWIFEAKETSLFFSESTAIQINLMEMISLRLAAGGSNVLSP